MLQGGLEVDPALRGTWTWDASGRFGAQLVPGEVDECGFQRAGHRDEPLADDMFQGPVAILESEDVGSLEVDTLGDAVVQRVGDAFVDAGTDPFKLPCLGGVDECVGGSFCILAAAMEPWPAARPPVPRLPPMSRVCWTRLA